jgi:T5orf172 domain
MLILQEKKKYIQKFNTLRFAQNLETISYKQTAMDNYIKHYSNNSWNKFASIIDSGGGMRFIKREIKRQNKLEKKRKIKLEYKKERDKFFLNLEQEQNYEKTIEIKIKKSKEVKSLIQGKTYLKEGFVYIIENEVFPGWLKIGSTIDQDARLRTYQTGDPFQRYKIAYSKYFNDRKFIELKIHAELQQYNKRGEWFEVPLSKAIGIINNIK